MQPLALHKKCGKQLEEPHLFFLCKKKKEMKRNETLHSRLVTEEYNNHLPN